MKSGVVRAAHGFALLGLAIIWGSGTVMASGMLWSCNAMCGRSIQSFIYVYGEGMEATAAFRQMERSCRPPNALFIGVQNAEIIPAALQSACVKNACRADD